MAAVVRSRRSVLTLSRRDTRGGVLPACLMLYATQFRSARLFCRTLLVVLPGEVDVDWPDDSFRRANGGFRAFASPGLRRTGVRTGMSLGRSR